jgi:D-threo-aldose 1-dehydrogenase
MMTERSPLPASEPAGPSRLAFGAATQGGLSRSVSELAAQTVFQAAWDAGIRSFDVAPWYGFGQAEERLGRFLQGREGFALSTKVGRVLRPDVPPHPSQAGAFVTDSPLNVVYDYSYDGVMRSHEASLTRLGVGRVETLYIHDPDVTGASVTDVLSGAGRALAELKAQGLVQHIGVGMNQWEMPLAFARSGLFDRFLLAGRYTLLEQTALPFMDFCADHDIGVVIGGVFNSGLLADPRAGAQYNYAPVSEEVLGRALALKAVCERYQVPLAAAALQFPLGHRAVAEVLTAARTTAQLNDNIRLFQMPLPAALWEHLRREGLISATVPTPTETP